VRCLVYWIGEIGYISARIVVVAPCLTTPNRKGELLQSSCGEVCASLSMIGLVSDTTPIFLRRTVVASWPRMLDGVVKESASRGTLHQMAQRTNTVRIWLLGAAPKREVRA